MRRDTSMILALAAIGGAAAGCGDATAPVEAADELRLALAGGDDQEAVTPGGGGHLYIGWGWMPDSLRVRLTDSNGVPLDDRPVIWTTTAGSVSPVVATTDAQGMATTRWSFYSPSTGWAPSGTYEAQATVAGAAPVTFSGHARAGVTLQSISFTPDTVSVEAGAAQAAVSIRLTDDRRDASLEHVSVQLYNPSATDTDFQSTSAVLKLAGGAPESATLEREWTGGFTVPADAEHGPWRLGRMTFSWGCGDDGRASLLGGMLEQLGLKPHLHVVASAGTARAGSAARFGSLVPEDPGRPDPAC
jgi:hypothetical protein